MIIILLLVQKCIKIWIKEQYYNFVVHDEGIFVGKYFENQKIISCSMGHIIKIWEKNDKNNHQNKLTIKLLK